MTKLEVTAGVVAGRGRRQRPTSTSPLMALEVATAQSQSITDAKAKFVASVSRGVALLMEERGYSRGRAQTALLRQISRYDKKSNSPPSDDEVFDVMSSHGLGMDDAAMALTVSKAVQREIEGREVSMIAAIDDLTSKLSVADLCRVDVPTPPATTATAAGSADDVVPVRIVPAIERVVTQQKRPQQKPATLFATSNTTASTCTSVPPSGRKNKAHNNKTIKHKNTTVANMRKRSVDDIAETNNKKEETPKIIVKRDRSDSLSEVVNAKFADKKNCNKDDDATSVASCARTSTGSVRSKRVRPDDVEAATQGAMKRSRSVGDL
ncbi:expressed unknown protein [Seminavis robusta]|uniref:Uncharacterized protein n=1 Tax=Seminavis robusta TaxID=568900 RepID=A0A9N8DHX2_9STRA|nr:expressed unknown protein [Seminavis robusta]|eukprot:Sro93_g048670.1 n/a (323) ;mRNA; r:100698-101859